MKWDKLYELQETLDNEILRAIKYTRDDVLEDKILALLVEVGELANETRCFKYWSKKGPSEQSVILEEFVDGIHFLLSLGIDFGYRYEENQVEKGQESTTTMFHSVYEQIYQFKREPTNKNYQKLMYTYVKLGAHLNFTETDIFHAYLDKNKVNHNRQQSGY